MSGGKRYFLNRFVDYNGQPVNIPRDVIKQRCTEIINMIFQRQGTTSSDCNGGIYVGVAGVAYMCHYLANCEPFVQAEKSTLLGKANYYITVAVDHIESTRDRNRDTASDVGFLLGNSGVWATAALISDACRQAHTETFLRLYADLANVCIPPNFPADELLVGRAGYLCGSLMLNKYFKNQVVPNDRIFELCKVVVESGRNYAKAHQSPCPLMYAYYGTEYLGAAHGLSGILQMLLCHDDFLTQDPKAEQDVKGSVDFLLSLQQPNGNFPCAMDEISPPRPEQEELVHWCHGSPGVVYLMVKAYLRWKDEAYLQASLRCGENVWEKGLLRKGPGICHGVAGNGYVFLLLYRLTNDPKHLYRALQFADFMFTDEFKQSRTPDCPYSLYEGLAGTACFLADLLQPAKAHFPFFDVF